MINYDVLHINVALAHCRNAINRVKLKAQSHILAIKERVMSYTHILVAVAVTPESHQLLAKAVSIARPVRAKVSLITLASDLNCITSSPRP